MPLRGRRIGVLQATIRPGARDISAGKLSHTLPATSVFDDPNLVSSVGLVSVLALVEGRLAGRWNGRRGRFDRRRGGAAARRDGSDFRRADGTSTLGAVLRGFTFGHVLQLDAVDARFLVALAGLIRLLGSPHPVDDEQPQGSSVLLDVDDTIVDVTGTPCRVPGSATPGFAASTRCWPRR